MESEPILPEGDQPVLPHPGQRGGKRAALDREVVRHLLPVEGDVEGILPRFRGDLGQIGHHAGAGRFARDVADRVIFMADGYVVEEGKPSEMFTNPKNERTRAFLSRILNS